MEGIDKLSRIPPYIRCRIVILSESGLNNCKIRDTFIREDTSRDIVIFETIYCSIYSMFKATFFFVSQNLPTLKNAKVEKKISKIMIIFFLKIHQK
jgi:hypothetical protein